MRENERRQHLHLDIIASLLATFLAVAGAKAQTAFEDPRGDFTLTIPAGFVPVPGKAQTDSFVFMYYVPTNEDEMPLT